MREPCERTVMVVEDDPYIRDSVAEVLRDDGFEVETASHGREALDLLTAGRPRPCVVLVDLMLPVMTGWELVSEMRSRPTLSEIPVVITSAAADRAPPNVDKVLSKPLRLDALLATVGTFCEQRASSPDPKNEALRELARKNVELAELRRSATRWWR